MYLLSVIGLSACKDVRLFDASSCPLTSPVIFYKLRYIERAGLLHHGDLCARHITARRRDTRHFFTDFDTLPLYKTYFPIWPFGLTAIALSIDFRTDHRRALSQDQGSDQTQHSHGPATRLPDFVAHGFIPPDLCRCPRHMA